jgi:DnaK suppressor protein
VESSRSAPRTISVTPCQASSSTTANFPDPADRASQEEEFALELRARDRERKLIKKIDKTLQLIKDEEYGWCESCGVEIGIRRLEARPTADLCVDCKTLAEIKEKQVGK